MISRSLQDDRQKLGGSYRVLVLALIVVSVLGLGLIVANREITFGSDTFNYAYMYSGNIWNSRMEIGYKWLVWVSRNLNFDVRLFFYFVYLILNISIALLVYCLVSNGESEVSYSIVLISVMAGLLSSNWYIAATTNGLRQGLSLPYIYISAAFFVRRRFFASLIAIAIACSFHQSSAAAAILFPSLLLPTGLAVILYLFLLFGYFIGLNEALVKIASNMSGIDVHGTIANYREAGLANYYGFDYMFVGYTVLSLCALSAVANSNLVAAQARRQINILLKILMSLSMSYFVFGFAAYANRFGYIAWFFTQICVAFLLLGMRVRWGYRVLAVLLTFIFGVLRYGYYVYNV